MTGSDRRADMVRQIRQSGVPLSGTKLAAMYHVSRQVIVQDIALLRVSYQNIISTNRGYLLYAEPAERRRCRRVVKVKHDREDIVRELDCIVDAGGSVLDVIVEHEIYGRLVGGLVIRSRADVRKFMCRVEEYGTKPLTDLTQGIHFHTIEAEQEEILEAVVEALEKEGFLLR